MDIFTTEELLSFNEMMLGRGIPNQDDGIGYNKGDFGACSTYYYGLSDAQFADLAKRLVKYTKTQLKIDREKMKKTAKKLEEKAYGRDRSNGISIVVQETDTLISFRYNARFVGVMQKLPLRKYNKENQCWSVPNSKTVEALTSLEKAGADVTNAIQYFKHKVGGQ